MECKCGGQMLKGYSKKIKREVNVCTSCGRAIFLDYRTGHLRVLWKGRTFGGRKKQWKAS